MHCLTQLLCTHAEAIVKVLAACQEGAKVVDLCQLGDSTINE